MGVDFSGSFLLTFAGCCSLEMTFFPALKAFDLLLLCNAVLTPSAISIGAGGAACAFAWFCFRSKGWLCSCLLFELASIFAWLLDP